MGKGFIQPLNGTTIHAERMFKTDSSVFDKMYVMSIHYNGAESYFFINRTQELKFAAATNLGNNKFCVANISDEYSITEMGSTGLFGNIYDVSSYYWPHSVSKIYDIYTNPY